MPKKLKAEWHSFLGTDGHRHYNPLCRKCKNGCKQSYRTEVVACPRFTHKR
jgi:hypothetical protein